MIFQQINYLHKENFMKSLDQFTNQYAVSKTLRFSLIPNKSTEEHIQRYGFLQRDEVLAKKYKQAKKIADAYHKSFIEERLAGFQFSIQDLEDYKNAYVQLRGDKNNKDYQTELGNAQAKLRKKIATRLKNKDLFNEKFIKKILPAWLETHANKVPDISDPVSIIRDFDKRTTYFKGFHENRKNIYTDKAQGTSIAHRVVHENLFKFLINSERYEQIKRLDALLFEQLQDVPKKLDLHQTSLDEVFTLSGFNRCLNQSGIDHYNLLLGGKSLERNRKIQGINELINLRAQKLNSKDTDQNSLKKQLHKSKMDELYKQILSDRTGFSYRSEGITHDAELCDWIQHAFQVSKGTLIAPQQTQEEEEPLNIEEQLQRVSEAFKHADQKNLYVRNNDAIQEISKAIFGDWRFIKNSLEHYVREKLLGRNKNRDSKKFNDAETRWLKKSYFSFDEVHNALQFYMQKFEGDELENQQNEGQDSDQGITDEIMQLAKDRPLLKYFCEESDIFSTQPSATSGPKKMLSDIKAAYPQVQQILTDYAGIEEEKIKETKKNGDENSESNLVLQIKTYLDPILDLFHFFKPVYIQLSPKEEKKAEVYEGDNSFYTEFNVLYKALERIVPLYDQTRNYLTKKSFSVEKYKLNFDNATLADGWDKNKEKDNTCVILIKEDNYYLAVMHPKHNKLFADDLPTEGDCYQKIVYKQIADASRDIQNLMVIDGKTVRKVGRRETEGEYVGQSLQLERHKNKYLPPEINEIRKKRSYLKGDQDNNNFSKQDAIKFIDYYRARLEYFDFEFNLKNSSEYDDFNDFVNAVRSQGYRITFQDVSADYIDRCVDEGKLFLFRIYNKDFSKYSTGRKNLQTLYWKALFSEENLRNVVYKLSGNAELFYRKASINYSKDTWQMGHHVNNPKKRQPYPIIKDKRYAEKKYLFHVPITVNFKAPKAPEVPKFNDKVNEFLKNNDQIKVIGIDRGERHLAYYSLINQKGEIEEQASLNIPFLLDKPHDDKEKKDKNDYRELLDKAEKDRDKARKSWETIAKIKDRKEGYLSQVIHRLTTLMLEHNAIIALEDLSFGFKKGRLKVEKQVYQKLEKALIDKLNYLVLKKRNDHEPAGVMHALQLTAPSTSFKKLGKQTGFIFYVPAYHTSKVCPATGFVNLLYPRYETKKKAKEFFGKFDAIRYLPDENLFCFDFDYKKFPNKAAGSKQKWSIYTYGTRLISSKNTSNNNHQSPTKKEEWSTKEVDLTAELKALFQKYGIDYADGRELKQAIVNQSSSDFFKGMIASLKLILQIRNSRTGTNEDWIISPVKDKNGNFFDTRDPAKAPAHMPKDADGNGAYHIALKGLLMLQQLQKTTNHEKFKPNLKDEVWYEFIQRHAQ